MKPIIVMLILITSVACSKEETTPQTDKTETNRISAAKTALDDAKKVDQTLMNSDAQQREAVEKAQQ